MKRFLTCLLLIYSLVILTACPTASLAKAKTESERLATYANAGVNLTRELFRAGFVNLATKDKIADGFIVLATAGQAFDRAVVNAEAQYGSNVPKSEIAKLFATFDAEVITKFLAVLSLLKIANVSGNFVAVIESIKAAVLVIGSAFRMKAAVQARLAGA